jgi:hypothetical protein
MPIPVKAKPTMPISARLDLETHELRMRMQEELSCQAPALIRKALVALAEQMRAGKPA